MKLSKFFNQKSVTLLFVYLFSFFLSSSVLAATFYIDSATGNDTRSSAQAQSQSTPWKHMPGMRGCSNACASYSVKSGDVFVLKGGETWTDTSTSSLITIGVSGITIQGGQRLGTPWGTGYPVLDGTGSTGARFGIYSEKSNVTIDGIKIYNLAYGIQRKGGGLMFNGGNTIELKNSWIDSMSLTGFYLVSASANLTNVSIHNNTFTNAGRSEIASDPALDSPYHIDGVQFYDNLYLGAGGLSFGGYHTDGLMIQGNNFAKHGYGVRNVKIYRNKIAGDWTLSATALIFLSGCNFSDPVNLVCRGSGGPYSTQNVEIYNNIISFENNSWLVGAISPALLDIQAGSHDGIKIYNNTIAGDAIAGAKTVSSCIFAGVPINNLTIKNNIVSGCQNGMTLSTPAPRGYFTGTFEVDNNLYNITYGFHRFINGAVDCRTLAACQAVGYEAHGVSGDPKFVALPSGGVTGSGNWHLQSSSPAIGKGINLNSYFTTDIDGKTRGGSWDIGAYQYTTPPAPPTNFMIVP
jgi:hypothetical protein